MRARQPEREVRRDEWMVAGLGALFMAAGLLVAHLLGQQPAPPLIPQLAAVSAGVGLQWAVLLAGLVCIGWAVAHHRWYFSPAQRWRRDLGDPEGWLDRHDYEETVGPAAIVAQGEQRAPHTGPALGRSPVPPTRHGFCVGGLVSGPRRLRGRPVYTPHARGILLVGPQGSGKSQLLLHFVLDAPGALLVSSTKPELYVKTERLRRGGGHPTALFNPLGVAELPNTVWWDPVAGCRDETIAERRAAALVRGAGGADGIERAGFWAGKATEVLRYYLMAAALGGLDMTAVMHWANNPDADPTPQTILDTHPDTPAGWDSGLRAILATNPHTRDGYFATVTSAVAFMDSPTVRAACRPGRGRGFEAATWLASHATLYLIGSVTDRRLAPLFTALTEHIFHEARRLAAYQPGGRLREPLTLLLDEVAQLTPVPLQEWAADSRGWGITVCAVVQARSQLAQTWGRDNAVTIWANLPTRLVLPGVNDQDTLEELSYLSGVRQVREITEGSNHHGSGGFGTSVSERVVTEPVITGPAIARMPRWHVYALGLCPRPAVVRYEPGYQRVTRELAALADPDEPDPDDPRRDGDGLRRGYGRGDTRPSGRQR